MKKTDNIGLYVRKASDIDELFAETTKEYRILGQNKKKDFIKCFWAPEFHVIGGRLWILFAVSADQWKPQCYMMRLKEGGEICNTEDWEEAKLVVDQAGHTSGKDGISLEYDTFFRGWNGLSCMVLPGAYRHSVRYGINAIYSKNRCKEAVEADK